MLFNGVEKVVDPWKVLQGVPHVCPVVSEIRLELPCRAGNTFIKAS